MDTPINDVFKVFKVFNESDSDSDESDLEFYPDEKQEFFNKSKLDKQQQNVNTSKNAMPEIDIDIMSFNCQGTNNKWAHVQQSILDDNVNIICLQDTRHNPKPKPDKTCILSLGNG